MSVDVVIRGGSVADGTGREPYRADVGVTGGRVAWVAEGGAPESVDVGVRIDATHRLLMPGFVDTHSHADGTHTRPDVAEALLRQGVTTIIVGQDGLGYAPGSAATLSASEEYFGVLDGPLPKPLRTGASISDLLTHCDGASPVNMAALVPLGTVWLDVAGQSTELTADQLTAMVRSVEAGLTDGAVGLSTGLEYVPNAFAGIRELTAACRPVAAAGLPHVTHMRGYELDVGRAFAEVAEVSRQSGVGLHVSHLRGPAAAIELLADGAEDEGLHLTFDTYPYVRGCTILSMRALPSDVTAGGRSATLARLASSQVRDQLIRHWGEGERESELAGVMVAGATHPDWTWAEGHTIDTCATILGRSVPETVLELLIGCQLQVSVVTAQPKTSGDEDMRRLLRRPEHTVGSDGIYMGSSPHPRAWGTFARLLGSHVRDLGDWSWGQAAVHLAARACDRFGLIGRGTIQAGSVGDLVVVDPATVRDEATYTSPRRPAVGIDDVLVSGVPVLAAGILTGLKPGSGLRAGAAR